MVNSELLEELSKNNPSEYLAKEGYPTLLKEFSLNDSIIDWVYLPSELHSIMTEFILDGLASSFSETETYMLTEKGDEVLRFFENILTY